MPAGARGMNDEVTLDKCFCLEKNWMGKFSIQQNYAVFIACFCTVQMTVGGKSGRKRKRKQKYAVSFKLFFRLAINYAN